jgi:diguanylate cyclase (GGDEF)-like protein
MELKAYLNILLKKWWIVVPAFLITLVSGIAFTYTQTPKYSATTTYVVVPSASLGDIKSFANGLDMLGRRAEIATTFSEIAMSHRIKKIASDSISLASPIAYSIASKLRAGTNIIEITVEGSDPTTVQALANEVGTATEKYVQELYEAFILLPLDEATMPRTPITPNKPLNIGLSLVLGFGLAAGLAFLSEYLETPLSTPVSLSIIDEETGAYNKEYFLRRLSEEMVRARRNRYSLSMGLLRVDNLSMLKGADSSKLRAEMLRQVATLAAQNLREEDIVARLEGNIMALLLPDMSGENAKVLVEYLQTRINWTSFQSPTNGVKINLKSVAGIIAYDHNGTSRDELLALANRALQLAEVEGDGRVLLMTNAPTDGDHVS